MEKFAVNKYTYFGKNKILSFCFNIYCLLLKIWLEIEHPNSKKWSYEEQWGSKGVPLEKIVIARHVPGPSEPLHR